MVSRFDRQYDRWQKLEDRRADRAAKEIDWGWEGGFSPVTFKAHRADFVVFDETTTSVPSEPSTQKWSRRQEKKARMKALKEAQRLEAEHREVTVAIREELGFGDW